MRSYAPPSVFAVRLVELAASPSTLISTRRKAILEHRGPHGPRRFRADELGSVGARTKRIEFTSYNQKLSGVALRISIPTGTASGALAIGKFMPASLQQRPAMRQQSGEGPRSHRRGHRKKSRFQAFLAQVAHLASAPSSGHRRRELPRALARHRPVNLTG